MTIHDVNDGISSTMLLETEERGKVEVAIKHFHAGQFVLEEKELCLKNNEMVKGYFNFILDGRMNFVRLIGQIKVDKFFGTRLMYQDSSMLQEISRRMSRARRYSKPCIEIAKCSKEQKTIISSSHQIRN